MNPTTPLDSTNEVLGSVIDRFATKPMHMLVVLA
jgi:hypothetical protein